MTLSVSFSHPDRAHVQQVFRVLDTDSDGVLSFAEFGRFFERAVNQERLLPELEGSKKTQSKSKAKRKPHK